MLLVVLGGCLTAIAKTRRIVADEGFRKKLLSAVLKAGAEVENALGSAQDIEGVIDADGNLTVVQTRPQM